MCCDALGRALKDELVVIMDKSYLQDARIMNAVESRYYIRRENRDSGYDYYGINFCPFCDMGIS